MTDHSHVAPVAEPVLTLEQFRAAVAEHARAPLEARIAELEAENAGLRKDAARWRWARPHFRTFSLDMGGQHSYAVTAPFGRIRGPSIDAAVDAAIAALTAQGEEGGGR